MEAKERLIVALDHPNAERALQQVDTLGDAVVYYKVGLELYIAEGRRVIEELRKRQKRVFLDLKLHDIPETVGRAVAVAASMGVEMMTVHASGGAKMLERAVEAARPHDVKILAVTVLTSLDQRDLAQDGIAAASVEEQVVRRARMAKESGCSGVICSPLEITAIRQATSWMLIVTPGVRRAAANDDQKRVATPRSARADGADMIVVGRPIRDASDPRREAQEIIAELG